MNTDFLLSSNFTEMDDSTFSVNYQEAQTLPFEEMMQKLTVFSMFAADNNLNFTNINGAVTINQIGTNLRLKLSSKAYKSLSFFNFFF